MDLVVSKKFPEAEVECQQWLKAAPDSADPLNCLGIVKLMQRDFRTAAQLFTTAIEMNPKFAEAHNNLGAVLMGEPPANGRIDCQHFSTAIALDSNYVDARENRANCTIQQAAIAADHPGGLEQRAKLFEQARAELAIVLAADTSSAAVEYHLGVMDLVDERYDEAEEHFNRCIELQPREAGCRNRLGSLYLATGRCALSVEAFRDDLALQPYPDDELADRQSLEAACVICPEACTVPLP